MFDQQLPVTTVGPQGSQYNHHTGLRGNSVYMLMKKSVSYVSVHLCLHLFPCYRHVGVLASFVELGEVAAVQ